MDCSGDASNFEHPQLSNWDIWSLREGGKCGLRTDWEKWLKTRLFPWICSCVGSMGSVGGEWPHFCFSSHVPSLFLTSPTPSLFPFHTCCIKSWKITSQIWCRFWGGVPRSNSSGIAVRTPILNCVTSGMHHGSEGGRVIAWMWGPHQLIHARRKGESSNAKAETLISDPVGICWQITICLLAYGGGLSRNIFFSVLLDHVISFYFCRLLPAYVHVG